MASIGTVETHISARYTHVKEERAYEEQIKKIQQK